MAHGTAHYAEKVGDTQQYIIVFLCICYSKRCMWAISSVAQSAGAVEYTDCFSAVG